MWKKQINYPVIYLMGVYIIKCTAGMLMAEGQGYYFSDVITLSRDTEAPDFGNAGTEKGIFTRWL